MNGGKPLAYSRTIGANWEMWESAGAGTSSSYQPSQKRWFRQKKQKTKKQMPNQGIVYICIVLKYFPTENKSDCSLFEKEKLVTIVEKQGNTLLGLYHQWEADINDGCFVPPEMILLRRLKNMYELFHPGMYKLNQIIGSIWQNSTWKMSHSNNRNVYLEMFMS